MSGIIGLVDRYGVAATGLILAMLLMGQVNDVLAKLSLVSERLVRLETLMEARHDGEKEKP